MERVILGAGETPPDAPDETIASEAPEESQEPQEEQAGNDRPEWLPPKFENPEALAKAYGSLEKKLSSQQAADNNLLSTEDFKQYEDEYLEKGGLEDESYAALLKKGLSKEVVDGYIEGRQLKADAQEAQVYDMTGGKEAYQEMSDWMTNNLEAAEVNAYNDQIEAGGDYMHSAIKGMWARFNAVGGPTGQTQEPKLIQGGKPQSVGGYNSLYEMKQDMSNPLYQAGDQAFHAMVDKRLSLSGDLQ